MLEVLADGIPCAISLIAPIMDVTVEVTPQISATGRVSQATLTL